MKSILLAIALAIPSALSAQGTGNCAPRDQVVEMLSDRWGETRKSVALSSRGSVVEVFASIDSGVTNPGGPMCLVASGQAYQELPPQPQGQEG